MLLVVSHDRKFLSSTSTDIIHMHSQRLDSYRGNYEVEYFVLSLCLCVQWIKGHP